MLRFSMLLVLTALPAAFNQLITFKDGKIGVNFAGYHAEAGLGGLLTGNAAHGGLSASAGTPHGQFAGAGLGGTVDNGQTRGGLYAGAQAIPGVGASTALGGGVDGAGASGGSGAEAHAIGKSTKTVKLSQTPQQPHYPQQQNGVSLDQRGDFEESDEYDDAPPPPPTPKPTRRRNKQKKTQARFDAPPQPPSNFDYTKFFDFGFFSNAAATYGGAPHPAEQSGNVHSYQKQLSPNTVVLHKTVRVAPIGNEDNEGVETTKPIATSKSKTRLDSGNVTYTAVKEFQPNPNFFNDIFNIPISALGAVNQFLNNLGGSVSVNKTVQRT